MSEMSLNAARVRRGLTEALKTPWAAMAALLLAVALLDPGNLRATVTFAGRALAGTARYILFAVLLLAWLRATGAEVLVARAFQGRELRMILLAALFGGLAPFCSCEVIPFVAGLLALGAPLSAVMAFWLSSPLIDPPTLLITAAALGWPFAAAKAVAAVGLGLFGGFAVRALTRRGVFAAPLKAYRAGGCGCGTGPGAQAETAETTETGSTGGCCASGPETGPETGGTGGCCGTAPDPGGRPCWRFWTEPARRALFADEFLRNGLFLLKWLALAYVLEALLVHYVPARLIAGLVGGEGALPVLTAALVGMPAYLNSYVAPAMVAGLMEQGMSAGAAMAFIVAGAVSSVPAMAAVWSLVTARVFAAYLALGLAGAVLAGLLFQAVA